MLLARPVPPTLCGSHRSCVVQFLALSCDVNDMGESISGVSLPLALGWEERVKTKLGATGTAVEVPTIISCVHRKKHPWARKRIR